MEYKEFIRHYTNILNAGKVTSKGVEKYVRKEVQLIAYGNGVSFKKALDDLIDIYFDQSMRNEPRCLQEQSTTAATNLFFIKFMDTLKDDKEKKVVVGRKITAGDTLGTYMSLGWGQARHEGGDTDVTRVVTPTSPKYNKLIDQSNRSSNTSSSKPSSSNDEIKDPFADDSEADDDEEVITGLIKMFSNEAHVSIPNYQYNHIKNSLLAMDQSDAIDLMYTVVNKVSQGEVQNPIGYLITSIASVKGGE